MQHYVERVNRFLDGWLEKDGYRRLLTEFVEEDHQYYLRVYIDFLEEGKPEEDGTEHTAKAKDQSARDSAPAETADETVLADAPTAKERLVPDAEAAAQDEEDTDAERAPLHTIGINDCANVSRRLSKWLDQQDFIKEVYTLEVCSRGFLPEDAEDPEDTGSIGTEESNTEKHTQATKANHKKEEYNGR